MDRREAPQDVARHVVVVPLHRSEAPVGEERALEMGSLEARLPEVGAAENCALEASPTKVCPAQVGFRQIEPWPDGIASLEPKSVKKKLKAKEFAAAVSRDDIAKGIAELGVEETQHVQNCIAAIRAEKDRLGV